MIENMFSYVFKLSLSLASFAESKRGIVDQGVGEDNSLDIFERIASISEPPLELISREILIFSNYVSHS